MVKHDYNKRFIENNFAKKIIPDVGITDELKFPTQPMALAGAGVGLTVAGLTVAGLTVVGLTVVGLTVAGLTVAGLTVAGLTVAGLAVVGLAWRNGDVVGLPGVVDCTPGKSFGAGRNSETDEIVVVMCE